MRSAPHSPAVQIGRLLARPWAGYAVTVMALVSMTAGLILIRAHLGLPAIGLLYLLVVVLVAARWGWGPGLAASLAANIAFNFFFVPPLHRFTVQAPANVVALFVFLIVAALTSALLARAREGEEEARRREQETALLYDLSRLIITDIDLTSTLSAICARVRDTFAARSCAVLLGTHDALTPAAWSGEPDTDLDTGDQRHAAEQARSTGVLVALGGRPGRDSPRIVGIVGRRTPVVFVPLRVGGSVVGVLRVAGRLHSRVFTADELRLLEAFADEAALVVDRDRLLRETARVEALHEADRLKSALLAAVSHDLRTPLASIKASASSLLQAEVEWDTETRREFLSAIDEEADRLTRLISNLLDLSRIEGGALRPVAEWYNVSELLETVAARLGRSITSHRLVLDLAPDTGEAPLDYVQISQVVTNLVENAAKFAPPGTEIRLGTRRVDGALAISVADQGPGVPPSERERVFDRFYRIMREGARQPGSGLGLAISKGLVEAHGGNIRVEDAPGGGARFVFALPAPPPPRSALAAEEDALVRAGIDAQEPVRIPGGRRERRTYSRRR